MMKTTVRGRTMEMSPRWTRVLVLEIRGPVLLGGDGKKKRASRVSEYKFNMSALASVLVLRFNTDVSFAHSR